LRLLRLEVREDAAECDWMARPADPWDAGVSRQVSEEHVSRQALEDAIAVRELLFRVLPTVESAVLRVFRPGIAKDPELIISGSVARDQQPTRYFHSVAMRAKLFGLQFWLEDGILAAMQEAPMNSQSDEITLLTARS
jgi:hypothetical protein